MEAALSPDQKSPDVPAPTDDGWRDEKDIAVIKQEIRRASYVYVYTDFNEHILVSRRIALELLDRTKRPVYASICSRARVSVFIHAEDGR
jgi:hypothetical protein